MPSKLLSAVLLTLTILTLTLTLSAAEYLSPVDFGFRLTDHGHVDLSYIPPGIAPGNFNHDDYMDVARFQGKCLEIYLNQGWGYLQEPTYEKYYSLPITDIRTEGEIWIDTWDIVVTLADGSEDRIENHGGSLQIDAEPNVFAKYSPSPPPRVSEADFQLVWESEQYGYGMDRCAVGDIDNDGIVELVTWYKTSYSSDSAFILIYKSIGDDEYELFMEERFTTLVNMDFLSQIMITDMDQNGDMEIMYTLDRMYFWEFSEPGIYQKYRSDMAFQRALKDITISDVDQDGILETSSMGSNSGLNPPSMIQVLEFDSKSQPPLYYFHFNQITNIFNLSYQRRLSAGDFNNDEVEDLVPGVDGIVISPDPIDLQYYSYDSTNVYNFTEEWLYTGYPFSCYSSHIDDLDNDGRNELFVSGGKYLGCASWVYDIYYVAQHITVIMCSWRLCGVSHRFDLVL